MSWPYQLPFIHNKFYSNPASNYFSPAYFPSFNQNQFFNNFSPSFLHSPSESSIILDQFTSNQLYNFGFLQSLTKFPLQNLKNEKQHSSMKIQEIESNTPERKENEEENQEKVKEKVYDEFGQEKLKKQKNMISHNCSLRNDTKNIPKNYGKAMLSYIQKNTRQVKQLLSKYKVDHLQFMIFVKSYKSKINTIHDLRQMWGENEKENRIMKCVRILSYHFMRKKCLPYIFNSRIKNFHTHIKYRKRIMEGIQNPQNFTKIKEF